MTLEAIKTTSLGWAPRLLAIAVLAALVLMVSPAKPASAARSITPAGPVCGLYNRRVSVAPPRIWASYRTEQVSWISQIQRWDSVNRRWYNYTRYIDWSSYNYYGQSVTSWGSKYVNSRMNYPVFHAGYYRVLSDVRGNQGGVTWTGAVGGGSYCWVS